MEGQRSENLLDMDDEGPVDSPNVPQNSFGGMSSLTDSFSGSSSAAPKVSANPLDDLLGLFDNAGLGGGQQSISTNGSADLFGGLGGTAQAQQPPKKTTDALDDLLF